MTYGNLDVAGDITFKDRVATLTLNYIKGLVDICISNDYRKLT